jgi:uncharacterized protein (DUF2267 family)
VTPGRLARAYAWVVVGLRHVIVVAWIAGAVAATLYLPGLGGAASSPLGDLVPKNAEATAASFALLAIVPLRSFREFAFVMAAGIAIDTFVVRPLLIPSLISLFGEVSWLPGRRIRTLSHDEFLERVASRSGLSPAEAAGASEAVLATLAERITRKERRVLAVQVPKPLRPALRTGGWRAGDFPLEEFLRRVAERHDGSAGSARENTWAVMGTLAEVVAKGEMHYLRAQLSDDYEAVLPGAEEVRPDRAGEPVAAG